MKNFLLCICFLPIFGNAQLPSEFYYSTDNKILFCGGNTITKGVYARDSIRIVQLFFANPATFWNTMKANYATETLLAAKMIWGNDTLPDSVGVRFRGNTSYTGYQATKQKLSFAIETDFKNSSQEYKGYNNFKFNNCAEDSTMMHEVIWNQMAARHIPMAKSNYIRLFLNGVDWGIYPNIQNIDKNYTKEWYPTNNGAMLRAIAPSGGGGGGWGNGNSGMNYKTDTNLYKNEYTIKFNDTITNVWQKLQNACYQVNQASTARIDSLFNFLDIDRILWQLACEIIYIDDDSYVYKGRMDYMAYINAEDERTTILEYDGNSTFESALATNASWTIFKNVTDPNYPLINKLLTVPELRQRYLAHARTILSESFSTSLGPNKVDETDLLIQALVMADTKKLYSNAKYTSSVAGTKTFFSTRTGFLKSNAELIENAPAISSAKFYNSSDVEYEAPIHNEVANIKASVTSASGINAVYLYYDNTIVGKFTKIEMFDDGLHNDISGGDGVYGAQIPGFIAGTMVRYYVEAIANNASKSASYLPTGAEHDVFVYHVVPATSFNKDIVINELVSLNKTGKQDEMGEYADWIEIHNKSNTDKDISSYYLTDDTTKLTKWVFPPFTSIPANGYIVVWCDEDGAQGPLHANFRLSSSGEQVYLLDNNLFLIDKVKFPALTQDTAYARIPNATGSFVLNSPTFKIKNDSVVVEVTSPYTKNLNGVVINEIVSVNTKGEIDEAGEYSDWIEIYNTNTYEVDLSFSKLSKIASNTISWTFPKGQTIAPNSYLMIYADSQLNQGTLHAEFILDDFNGMVNLVDSASIVKQSISYSNPTSNLAYARIPNGTGSFVEKTPTFNLKNETVFNNINGIVINEINAYNESGSQDELDGYDNWLELYNTSNESVDISGYYLSDEATQLARWQIPVNTIMKKDEYIIVWTDNQVTEGPFHANWILDLNGGKVYLYDPLLRFVDQMTYGKQIKDSSYARVPNGTGNFKSKSPSFKANNVTGAPSSVISIESQDLIIYPIPSKDNFSILAGKNVYGDITYQILDLTGRIVKAGKAKSKDQVSISNLNPGSYIVKLSTHNQVNTIKLIKE